MKAPKWFGFLVVGKATSKMTVLIIYFFSLLINRKNPSDFSLAISEKEKWDKKQEHAEIDVMMKKYYKVKQSWTAEVFRELISFSFMIWNACSPFLADSK